MEDLFFLLSKVFWTAARPGNFLILVAVLGLLLVWWRRRRIGMVLVSCGIGGLVAVALLPLDQAPLWLLEQRFPTVRTFPERVDGIIVLGGAVSPLLTADHDMPSLNEAAERMTTFVALARRYPDARLIFTGGNGNLRPGVLTEARAARQLFDQLGLAGREIAYEEASRNTYENAVFSRAMMKPQPGETWLLVTSAYHMPRSVGIFRQLGWAVVPVPVGYKSGRLNSATFAFDLASKLGYLDTALHEWAGLVAYRLMGRTDSLFPAP